MIKTVSTKAILIATLGFVLFTGHLVQGQGGQRDGKKGGGAKPVTVPVTIRLREQRREYEMTFVNYVLKEDGEVQTILSTRKAV